MSLRGSGGNAIMRWDPDTESFRRFSETDGLPDLKISRANGFFEDRTGQIWIGLHRLGVIAAISKAGSTCFANQTAFRRGNSPVPSGPRRSFVDGFGAGRHCPHRPSGRHPVFVRYGISQGLSGNEIQAITEDQWGRIYIGTGHGVDRLDPVSGHVRWYTTADGLAPGEIQTAIRDRNGVLWFGTVSGVSSLIPEQNDSLTAPTVNIAALRTSASPVHTVKTASPNSRFPICKPAKTTFMWSLAVSVSLPATRFAISICWKVWISSGVRLRRNAP